MLACLVLLAGLAASAGARPAAAAFDSTGKELLKGEASRVVAYGESRLLVGKVEAWGGRAVIVRLRADGSRDRSFETPAFTEEQELVDFVVQSDGKVLVLFNEMVGEGKREPRVGRLLPSGRWDRSFGEAGAADTGLSAVSFHGDALALGGHGRILVAVTIPGRWASKVLQAPAEPYVVRLHADGSVDQSFAGGRVELPTNDSDGVLDLVRGPSGSIFVLRGALRPSMLTKLSPTGDVDVSFGAAGTVALDGLPDSDGLALVNEVGVCRDEEVALVGTLTRESLGSAGANVGEKILALRLRADGALDRSYGVRGRALAAIGPRAFASSFALQKSGRLVVGATVVSGPRSHLAALAFDPYGDPERSFGRGGRAQVRFEGNTQSFGLVAQPGNRLTLAGMRVDIDELPPSLPTRIALARLALRSS